MEAKAAPSLVLSKHGAPNPIGLRPMWAKLPLSLSRLWDGLGVGRTEGSLATFNLEALPLAEGETT